MWVSMQGKDIAKSENGNIPCCENPADTGSEPIYLYTEAEHKRAIKDPFENSRKAGEKIMNTKTKMIMANGKVDAKKGYKILATAVDKDIQNFDKELNNEKYRNRKTDI